MVELCRCPRCGHWNPPAREACFRCQQKVDPEAAARAMKEARKRRGPRRPAPKKSTAAISSKSAAGAEKASTKGSAPKTSRAAQAVPAKRKFPLGLVVGAVVVVGVIAALLMVLRGGGSPGSLLGPSDTTPPALASVQPARGEILPPGTVTIRGTASEPLARASVDGWDAQVTATGFSVEVPVKEGEVSLKVDLEDKAGNKGSDSLAYMVLAVPEGLEYAGTDPAHGARLRAASAPMVELLRVGGGTFSMGSEAGQSDERPVHEVTLSPYLMAVTETTNGAYAAYVEATGAAKPADPGWGGELADYFTAQPDYPVLNVSWDDAAGFCEWLGLRLPTEEEWEFAARGPESRVYPWGNEDPSDSGIWRAVTKPAEDGYRWTSPVGSLSAGISPFGMQDMAGNVWEWTADGFASYPAEAVTDPEPDQGRNKVLRGGSWTSSEGDVRSANRWNQASSKRGNNIGFRCAGDL